MKFVPLFEVPALVVTLTCVVAGGKEHFLYNNIFMLKVNFCAGTFKNLTQHQSSDKRTHKSFNHYPLFLCEMTMFCMLSWTHTCCDYWLLKHTQYIPAGICCLYQLITDMSLLRLRLEFKYPLLFYSPMIVVDVCFQNKFSVGIKGT